MTEEMFVEVTARNVLGLLDDNVRDYLDANGYGWQEEDTIFVAALTEHIRNVYSRYE